MEVRELHSGEVIRLFERLKGSGENDITVVGGTNKREANGGEVVSRLVDKV